MSHPKYKWVKILYKPAITEETKDDTQYKYEHNFFQFSSDVKNTSSAIMTEIQDKTVIFFLKSNICVCCLIYQ